MTKLLLAPHSDDETLFAAFVQLAERPRVVVCLQGRRARHLPRNGEREAESAASAMLLGTDVAFIASPCDPPDWQLVERELERVEPEHVYAPLPELDGAAQHNAVGNLAVGLYGPERVTFYATYTIHSGRSQVGAQVLERDGWRTRKLQALTCFRSQASKPDTAMHFHRDPAEYLTPAADAGAVDGRQLVKLNLGAGPNQLDGFHNLDPTFSPAWRFEDGLPMYADASVDAITVSHVLMYVAVTDWPAVVAELARVLKPGGVLRITEDAIGGPGSSRREMRPHAKVATSAELVLWHLDRLNGELVTANVSYFRDRSLIQTNYGHEPDVFHVEGIRS